MAVYFAASAARHRISQARALQVLEHHVWSFDAGRGVTLMVGPDPRGIDLEVGIVERDGDIYVIHAMRLRGQFRAEYRRHLPWPR